jgi:Heterokaryon incompatibility protein (HET)
MSGSWLDFYVFWATVVLRVEPFVGKCIDHIRCGTFVWMLNGPRSVLTANNLSWAAVRIFFYVIQPLKQRDNPKNEARAVEMAVQASIWVAIVIALFREGSPMASSELDALVESISSRFPWAYWAYWAVVALWCTWSPFQWFLLRQYATFRRIDRIVSSFKNAIGVKCIADGLYLLRKHRGHLLRVAVRCLEELVELTIFTYINAWLLGRWYGPMEGSWRDFVPLYRYVAISMLIYYGIFYRWPTLRKGPIIDIIWDTEPEFEYKKLRPPGHIRLLLLHPRNPIDAINCTLFEVDSKAAPLYEAISYTWGDPLETGHIRANGFRLRVPKSAYTVLENRSSMWTPRLLWIDSMH